MELNNLKKMTSLELAELLTQHGLRDKIVQEFKGKNDWFHADHAAVGCLFRTVQNLFHRVLTIFLYDFIFLAAEIDGELFSTLTRE